MPFGSFSKHQAGTHRDQHAAVLLHAPQNSQVAHTGDDGAGHDQRVGGVDRPEGGDEGGEPGVHHLELPEGHHEGSTQLQDQETQQVRRHDAFRDLSFIHSFSFLH